MLKEMKKTLRVIRFYVSYDMRRYFSMSENFTINYKYFKCTLYVTAPLNDKKNHVSRLVSFWDEYH